MAGRFDFQEQTSQADDEGRQSRPDFIVRLPGGGMFVIDAKVPLAFDADEEGDEDSRAHARSPAHRRQPEDPSCASCRPRPIRTSSSRAPTSWPCSCPATPSCPRRWTMRRT